jgi:hypothetical protein
MVASQAGNFSGSRTRQRVFQAFDERILHDIFGFLAVLQNAVSDGEKYSAVRADDHFKCLSIAVNGRPVLFAFTVIHWLI